MTAEANLNYLIRKPGATFREGPTQSQWSATQSLRVYKSSLELSFTFTHLSLLLSYPRLHPSSFSSSPLHLLYLGSGHRLLLGTSLKVTGTGDASGLSGILGSGGCSLAAISRSRCCAVSLWLLSYLHSPLLWVSVLSLDHFSRNISRVQHPLTVTFKFLGRPLATDL